MVSMLSALMQKSHILMLIPKRKSGSELGRSLVCLREMWLLLLGNYMV